MNDETPAPTENEDSRAHIWEDDVLDRRGFADFLTNALTEQTRVVSERQQRGLTVALDAGWGTGKTFFVKHWAEDLKQRGHPVVFFDAWENDLGEEAAIALMAAIKETIDEWVARMPVKQKLAARAGEMVRDGVKELRRAVLPASKVVAAGMLKKFTGIGVKEFMDAVDGDDALSVEPQEELSSEKIEAGLDKIFESALAEQKKRSEAIVGFKTMISNALELIERNTNATLPAFVFVDELDRCRPSYAIRLLEEIKHVFGMKKVCFVLSTNLTQLQESVRAIYGSSFDGYGYLKRFFDTSYSLPPPESNAEFVEILLQESSSFSSNTGPLLIGLNPEFSGEDGDEPGEAIAAIFALFDLDLRSQKQVFSIADSAASSLKNEEKIHLIWLFFLAAVVHKFPGGFLYLKSNNYDKDGFNNIFLEKVNHRISTHFGPIKKSPLFEIIHKYCKYSTASPGTFISNTKAINSAEVEYQVAEAIIQPNSIEFGSCFDSYSHFGLIYRKNPISSYIKLVEYAGYISSKEHEESTQQ